MSKTCTPFLVVFQLRDLRRCGSYVFYCVASAAHFLFLGVDLMTEKDFIENYKKDIKRREDQQGRFMLPWTEDEREPENANGTLGILRQLYMYKKMYTRLHNTIVNIVKDCKDTAVKEKLTDCLIDTEQLYVTKGILPPDYMSSEELIIAYLLAYIRKREVKIPAEYLEIAFFKESLDWLKDLSAKEQMCDSVFGYADAIDDYDFSEENCTSIVYSKDEEN